MLGNLGVFVDPRAARDLGSAAANTLRIASNVASGETVTVGGDIYEIEIVNSDTFVSVDTSNGTDFNNIIDPLTVINAVITYPGVTFAVGLLVRLESEIMAVTGIAGNDVTFDRGVDGTTTVAHLAVAIFEGAGTIGTDFTNTTDPLAVTGAVAAYPGLIFTVGKLIRIENEIMVVTVVAAGDVTFKRGVSNTTAASHAEKLTIFEGDGIVSGIALGLVTTLTPTAFTPALVADINGRGSESILATQISVNEMLVATADVPGGTPVQSTLITATTETLGGVNNAWDGATLGDGEAPGNISTAVSNRVPTTQEVALGNMHFVLPFSPKGALVTVFTTSTGVQVAWNGLITITGNVVTVDNSGAVDWSTAETVSVLVTN